MALGRPDDARALFRAALETRVARASPLVRYQVRIREAIWERLAGGED